RGLVPRLQRGRRRPGCAPDRGDSHGDDMNAEQMRALQNPLKTKYRAEPAAARGTLRATGKLNVERLTCTVPTFAGLADAGLHPATGGDGKTACSGDMLLESLVACAGVTLTAVATAMGVTLRGGTGRAEGA